jgi:hypothetical protein
VQEWLNWGWNENLLARELGHLRQRRENQLGQQILLYKKLNKNKTYSLEAMEFSVVTSEM